LDSASPVYPCQERHYVCFWAVAWQVPLRHLGRFLGDFWCRAVVFRTVTSLGATCNRFPAGQIGAASLAPRGPRLTIGLGGVFQGFLGLWGGEDGIFLAHYCSLGVGVSRLCALLIQRGLANSLVTWCLWWRGWTE
jgi:hypothetical protein